MALLPEDRAAQAAAKQASAWKKFASNWSAGWKHVNSKPTPWGAYATGSRKGWGEANAKKYVDIKGIPFSSYSPGATSTAVFTNPNGKKRTVVTKQAITQAEVLAKQKFNEKEFGLNFKALTMADKPVGMNNATWQSELQANRDEAVRINAIHKNYNLELMYNVSRVKNLEYIDFRVKNGLLAAHAGYYFYQPEVTALQLAMSDEFDATNSGQVKHLQTWANAHAPVKIEVDGIYGEETFGALETIARIEKEKEIAEEVKVIQEELVHKGHLKLPPGFKDLSQLVSDAWDNPGSSLGSLVLEQAWKSWAHMGGMAATVGDWKRLWIEEQVKNARLNTVPGYFNPNQVELLRIPDGLETYADSMALDEAFAKMEEKADLQRHMAEENLRAAAEEASRSLPWWQRPGEVVLNGLSTAAEALGKLAAIVDRRFWALQQSGNLAIEADDKRDADYMNAVLTDYSKIDGYTKHNEFGDPVVIRESQQVLAEGTSYKEAMKQYDKWVENNPTQALMRQMFLDPLNFVSFGTVGTAGKVLRVGTKYLKTADDIAEGLNSMQRVGNALDRGATVMSGINRLRDVMIPAFKAVTITPWTKGLRGLARKAPGFIAKPSAKMLKATEALQGSAKLTKQGIREGVRKAASRGFGIKTVFGSKTDDLLGIVGRAELDGVHVAVSTVPIWEKMAPGLGHYLRNELYDTTHEVIAKMTKAMPNVIRYMDNVGCRLFLDEADEMGDVMTYAGQHVRALLHGEAFKAARDAYIEAGKATLKDFPDSHFVSVNAKIADDFHTWFTAYQDMVEQVWLPALDSHAQKQGFGFMMSEGRHLQAQKLLKESYEDMVMVFNPNRVRKVGFSNPAAQAAWEAQKIAVTDARAYKSALRLHITESQLELSRLRENRQEYMVEPQAVFGDQTKVVRPDEPFVEPMTEGGVDMSGRKFNTGQKISTTISNAPTGETLGGLDVQRLSTRNSGDVFEPLIKEVRDWGQEVNEAGSGRVMATGVIADFQTARNLGQEAYLVAGRDSSGSLSGVGMYRVRPDTGFIHVEAYGVRPHVGSDFRSGVHAEAAIEASQRGMGLSFTRFMDDGTKVIEITPTRTRSLAQNAEATLASARKVEVVDAPYFDETVPSPAVENERYIKQAEFYDGIIEDYGRERAISIFENKTDLVFHDMGNLSDGALAKALASVEIRARELPPGVKHIFDGHGTGSRAGGDWSLDKARTKSIEAHVRTQLGPGVPAWVTSCESGATRRIRFAEGVLVNMPTEKAGPEVAAVAASEVPVSPWPDKFDAPDVADELASMANALTRAAEGDFNAARDQLFVTLFNSKDPEMWAAVFRQMPEDKIALIPGFKSGRKGAAPLALSELAKRRTTQSEGLRLFLARKSGAATMAPPPAALKKVPRLERIKQLEQEINDRKLELDDIARKGIADYPDSPDQMYRALEAEIMVQDQKVSNMADQIRRLQRKLEGETTVDPVIAAEFIDELKDVVRQRISKWKRVQGELGKGSSPELNRAKLHVRDALQDEERFLKHLEGGSLSSKKTYDEMLASLDGFTKEWEKAKEHLDTLWTRQRNMEGEFEDAGAVYFSTKEYKAALKREQAQWTQHYEEYIRTAKQTGTPFNEGNLRAEHELKMADIYAAWKYEKGRGWYDARGHVETPRMYMHNRGASDQAWLDTGIAFDGGQSNEMQTFFQGYDPAGIGDMGLTPKVGVNTESMGKIQELEKKIVDLMAQGSDLSILPIKRRKFIKEAEGLRKQIADIKKRTGFDLRTVGKDANGKRVVTTQPLSEMPGSWYEPMLPAARKAEKEVVGHAGRETDTSEFIAALNRRKLVVDKTAQAFTSVLYKQNALYLDALRYSSHRFVRGIYKGVYGGTYVWRTATLPFRPAWLVGNVADNATKCLLAGVKDPRAYIGKSGHTALSLMMMDKLLPLCKYLDNIHLTRVHDSLEQAIGSFLEQDEGVICRLFALEDIPIPASLTEETLSHFFLGILPDDAPIIGKMHLLEDGTERVVKRQAAKGPARKVVGVAWAMMGTGPENLFRKGLYRDTYRKALANGMTAEEAMKSAMKAVDDTLFDYSDRSVLEENLRLFFPFITFAKKNMVFWPDIIAENPWFLSNMERFMDYRDNMHSDKPGWMQRYFSTDQLGDWLSHAGWPGKWLATGLFESGADPINLFSFAPLYRMFKVRNQMLPEGSEGIPFLSTLLDAIDQYGLAQNPLIRKPLEQFGLVTPEEWRSAFPGNDIIESLTTGIDWITDRWPRGLDIEAIINSAVFGWFQEENQVEYNERTFNELVELEIAEQLQRGETADIEKAKDFVRQVTAARNIVGYFTRLYTRSMTPEDIALYLATDEAIKGGWDPDVMEDIRADNPGYNVFNQYLKDKKYPVGAIDFPALVLWAEAKPLFEAYMQVPYAERNQFLADNPTVLKYVYQTGTQHETTSHFLWHVRMSQNYENLMYIADKLRSVTMGLTLDQIDGIKEIVSTPALEAYVHQNETPEEERVRLYQGQLWRHYDELMDGYLAIPAADLDSRDSYLSSNPLLKWWWTTFDSNSGKVAVSIAKNANRSLRNIYFKLMDYDTKQHDKYKRSNLAKGFLMTYPFIFEFTDSADFVTTEGLWVPKNMRAFVEHSEGWAEWAMNNPLDAAEAMFWQKFYSTPAELRPKLLREFGVKYGYDPETARKGAQMQSDVLKRIQQRGLRNFNHWMAEWDELYPLLIEYFKQPTAEKRAQFQKLHPVIGRYLDNFSKARKGHTRSARAAAYLRVKGLLDEFFKIKDPVEKQFFLETHPALQEYFKRYAHAPEDMPDDVYKQMREYYDLPAFSSARKEYLDEHPELRNWLNDRPGDAEGSAVHDLLETYFALTDPNQRDQFLLQHPELQVWFDERRAMQDRISGLRKEWDFSHLAWLRDLYQKYSDLYFPEAERIRATLAKKPHSG